MKNILFIGVLTALGTGFAIGAQATLVSRAGTMIGPIRTGLIGVLKSWERRVA